MDFALKLLLESEILAAPVLPVPLLSYRDTSCEGKFLSQPQFLRIREVFNSFEGVVTLTDGFCKVTDAAFSNSSNGRFPGVKSLEPVVSDSHSGAAACWDRKAISNSGMD